MGTGLVASAKTNKSLRTKSVAICAVLLVLTIMGIALAAFNVFKAVTGGSPSHWLFAVGYLVGVALACMYIMITMNTAFSTLVTTDKRYIILKCWDNSFLPYDVSFRVPFIRDFVPAKTDVIKIPIKEISHVCIGTKNFIKRNAGCNDFAEAISAFEKPSASGKKAIGRIDIIYIETVNNECGFMSINNFDPKAVVKVIQCAKRVNPDIEVLAGSRIYRRAL